MLYCRNLALVSSEFYASLGLCRFPVFFLNGVRLHRLEYVTADLLGNALGHTDSDSVDA